MIISLPRWPLNGLDIGSSIVGAINILERNLIGPATANLLDTIGIFSSQNEKKIREVYEGYQDSCRLYAFGSG